MRRQVLRHVAVQVFGLLRADLFTELFAQGVQLRQQFRLRRRQLALRERLQHLAHARQHRVQHVVLLRRQLRRRLAQVFERGFQGLGQVAQRLEADSGRGAGQGVHRLQGVRRDVAPRFVAPLAEVALQRAQQLVGFGDVDVVQGQRDFQRADAAHAVVLRRRRTGGGRQGEDIRGGRRGFGFGRFGGFEGVRLGCGFHRLRLARLRRFPGGQVLRRFLPGAGCRRLFRHEGLAGLHAFGGGDQRRAAARRLSGLGQFRHPGQQLRVRVFGQRQQVGRGGAAVGQPDIHYPFERGRGGGEVVQADHARAALECMEGAAHDGQRVLGRRIGVQLGQRGGDHVQHLAGFGHENLEQLGVDGVRLRKRLRRRRRRVGGKLGCRFGRKRGRSGRLRILGAGLSRKLSGCMLLGLLDAQFAQQPGFLVEGEADLGALAVLAQHVGKEAERADIPGDVVQRRGLGGNVAFALPQRAHRVAHVHGGARGFVLVEDAQRAFDLMEQGRGRVERAAFELRLVVVFVEQLLDLAQAALDLAGQHGHGLALLDAAGQFVLPLRRVRRRFTGGQGQQALAHHFGVLVEVLGQLAHLVQAVFDEQHGRRHLQPELVAAAGGDRVAGGLAELAQQLGQRRRAEFVAGAGQGGQGRVEVRFAGIVGVHRQLVPVGLRAGQRFLGFLQRGRVDLAVAALGIVGRHRAFEAEGAAQFGSLAFGLRCGGNEEQRIAQHRVRQAGLALRQAAQLQVDLAEQLFHIQIGGQGARGDQGRKAVQRAPEGARTGVAALRQRRDRVGQGLCMLALGLGIGALQVGQQRLFETCAAAGVVGRAGIGRRRQVERERRIHHQQVGRMDALGAEQFLQRAVIREQARRLRRRARDQLFQVFADRAIGVAHGFRVVRRAGQRAVLEAVERALGGGGDQPHPFHVHHLQRAVGLVQMGLRMQQQGRLGFERTRGGVVQRAARALQRIADFADHPRQRSGIEGVRWQG